MKVIKETLALDKMQITKMRARGHSVKPVWKWEDEVRELRTVNLTLLDQVTYLTRQRDEYFTKAYELQKELLERENGQR